MISAEIVRDLFLARLQPPVFSLESRYPDCHDIRQDVRVGFHRVEITRYPNSVGLYVMLRARNVRRAGVNLRLGRMHVPGLGSLRAYCSYSPYYLEYEGVTLDLWDDTTSRELVEAVVEQLANAMLAGV